MQKQPAVRVRRADRNEVDAILDCLREAFAPYRASYTPEAFLDTVLTPETLDQRFHTMTIFVADAADGLIVGTIACQRAAGSEGHIRGMAVRPVLHGQGVAQQLLDAAEAEMRNWGCGRATLDTTMPLRRAMRFYEKNGYRRTGMVRDFFGMPLHEYEKDLRHPDFNAPR